MMDYKFLLYDVRDGVATITLNRPEVYNALNDEITFELQDALKAAGKDEWVRVVVLTGAGKAFCSGQDLKANPDKKRSFLDSLHRRYNPIIRAMRNMPKPVIGRVNGVAAGAGCSLALACDMIVMAEEASLIEVFVNIGLVPDSGSSWFLPRLAGMAKAFEWSAMGSKITAEEALRAGLVNRVTPGEKLDEAMKPLTDYFAKAPTKAIGIMKKMLNKAGTATLDEMLDYEAYMQEVAGATHDHQEGVKAFLEKRKPDFLGK